MKVKTLSYRKGQSAQFNWVFIIFAGAVVLAFFAVFVFKYADLENKKTNIQILRTVDGNIEVLESSGEDMYCDTSISQDCLSLGLKSKLKYYCIENKSVIDINGEALELKDEVVFMPSSMHTRDLSFWIKSWDYPYHVANLLFITNPERKFYFVYDSQENKDYIESLEMPVIFNYEVVSKSEFKGSNGIYFTNSMPSEGLHVNEGNKIITFIKEGKQISYIDDQLLVGAFFVDDFKTYKCGLERSINRLDKIFQIRAVS